MQPFEIVTYTGEVIINKKKEGGATFKWSSPNEDGITLNMLDKNKGVEAPQVDMSTDEFGNPKALPLGTKTFDVEVSPPAANKGLFVTAKAPIEVRIFEAVEVFFDMSKRIAVANEETTYKAVVLDNYTTVLDPALLEFSWTVDGTAQDSKTDQLKVAINATPKDIAVKVKTKLLKRNKEIDRILTNCQIFPKMASPVNGVTIDTILKGIVQAERFNQPRPAPVNIHHGLDIDEGPGGKAIARGDRIDAVWPGVVILDVNDAIGGEELEINHGNGLRTGYAHLDTGSKKVAVNGVVAAGDHIAGAGSTGIGAFGTVHLHFEIILTPNTPARFTIDPQTGAVGKLEVPIDPEIILRAFK